MTRKNIWIFKRLLCVYTFLVIKNIRNTDASPVKQGKTEGSDEQTALKQALLLVKLLKLEYTRVLRENDVLQKKNTLREPENLPTCAITDNPVVKTPRSTKSTGENTAGFRRKLRLHPDTTNSYYENHTGKDMWRRFQYDDPFGPQPGVKNNTLQQTKTSDITHITSPAQPPSKMISKEMLTTPEPNLDTSNSQIVLQGTISEQSTTNLIVTEVKTKSSSAGTIESKTILSESSISVMDTFPSSSMPLTQTASRWIAQNKNQSYSRRISKSTDANNAQKAPEIVEAAEELAKELQASIFSTFAKPWYRFSDLRRGTTKVYLADSTRYPIPLPANHAFCYTNPESALCRTFIRK